MAIVSKDNKVVTVINVFRVKPENQQRLIDVLIQAGEELMTRLPGYISANIHKSLDGTRVVNYTQWVSKEAYEVIFERPQVRKHMEEAVKIGKGDYHLYEIVYSHEVSEKSK